MNNKMKIKKGDTVVVTSGTNKNKSGKVIAVYPKEDRVLVEGVNLAQKHKKARSANEQGGILSQEAPINISNIMLLCNSCKKATRSKVKIKDSGMKIRVCGKCGAEFDK